MISVLIRTQDKRVFDCIKSVQESSPTSKIVISTVPDKNLVLQISKLKINYCVVSRKNGSITTNKGLELVKTIKVLITDSDTVFDKNCIKLMENALNKYDVVKAHIVFQNDGSLKSILIANLRTYFNSKSSKMYTPGLAFKMSIKNKIGGYYFDNKVAWSEDSEFSNRVEKNLLKTYVEKKAKLFHPSVSLSHDLASAFLTGAKKLDTKTVSQIIINRIKTHIEIFKGFGIKTLLYGLVWYLLFDCGKLSKYFGKIGLGIQDYFWKL